MTVKEAIKDAEYFVINNGGKILAINGFTDKTSYLLYEEVRKVKRVECLSDVRWKTIVTV